jgi:ABC-type antimicrobial peptide transport system permease subunit
MHVTSLAARKLKRQAGWSLLCFVILTAGLTQWISLTSIGTSVQAGFNAEVSSEGSYVGVLHLSGQNSPLPSSVITQIQTLPGVVKAYPLNVFTVYLLDRENFSSIQCVGNCPPSPSGGVYRVNTSLRSLVVGTDGLPPELLQVSEGNFPLDNESGVVLDTTSARTLRSSAVPPTDIGDTLNITFGGESIHPVWTGVGELSDGLEGAGGAFWSPASLRHMIGNETYNRLIALTPPNAVIVKAASLSDAARIAEQITNILSQQNILYNISSNPLGFNVVWDESLSQTLQSFESNYAPLYDAVSLVGLIVAGSLFVFVAFLVLGRSLREVGLLFSQGLNVGQVTELFAYYFGIIAFLSYLASSAASWFVVPKEPFSYVHLIGYQQISTYVTPDSLVFAALLTVGVILLSSILLAWRLRRLELDVVLREY